MSSFTCISCRWENKYQTDSEFRKLWQIFEDDGIWYCKECCDKYQISKDINGDEIDH